MTNLPWKLQEKDGFLYPLFHTREHHIHLPISSTSTYVLLGFLRWSIAELEVPEFESGASAPSVTSLILSHVFWLSSLVITMSALEPDPDKLQIHLLVDMKMASLHEGSKDDRLRG